MSELWFFIGGAFFGATLGIVVICIFSIGKDLPEEDYPLNRRASDHDFLTDDDIAELRGLRDTNADRPSAGGGEI